MDDKSTHVSETQDAPSGYQQSERFDFRRSPSTVGGYNSGQTINLEGSANAAKWDVENSFEVLSRDKSWKSDPTNWRNK